MRAGTELSFSHALANLRFRTTLRSRHGYHSDFTEETTEHREIKSLFKVLTVKDITGIWTQGSMTYEPLRHCISVSERLVPALPESECLLQMQTPGIT